MRDVGTLTKAHREFQVLLTVGACSTASGLGLVQRYLPGKLPMEAIPDPLSLQNRKRTIR